MTRFANVGASSIFLFLAILLVLSRFATASFHSAPFFVASSAIVALAMTAWLGERKDIALGFSALCAFFIILLVWALATTPFYDPGFDGYAYHLSAIWDIADGWNPFLSPHNNIWVDSYPNGYWVLQSYIVATTGLLMSGQSLTFGLMAVVALLSYGFFSNRLAPETSRLPRFSALLFAGIVAANPVVVGQLLTHYVDAPLYLFGTALSLFLLSEIFSPNRLSRTGAIACIILMVNTKTAALYYTPLILFGGFIAELALSKAEQRYIKQIVLWIRSKGLLFGVTFIIGVTVIGYKPYVANVIDHEQLLYPSVEKIMKGNEPSNVIPLSAPMKFIYGIFARTDHSEWPIDAAIEMKIPGTFHLSEFKYMRFDTRRGGFGPFFSLALIASIAAYGTTKLANLGKSKYGRHRKGDCLAVFGMVLIAASMLFPESWWARYVPFTWLGAILLAVAALHLTGEGRIRILNRALLGVAIFSFMGCVIASGTGALHEGKILYKRMEKIDYISHFPVVKILMFYSPPAYKDFQSSSTQDGLSVWTRLLADRGIQTEVSRELSQYDCDVANYLNGGIYWCIVIDDMSK